MREIWKEITGFKGLYKISNHGRVKSVERIVARKNNYLPIPERILKPGKGRDYLHVNLCKDGISKSYKIHLLVAKHFVPNIYNKPQVNHKDGNKHNNYYTNLKWCTQSENITHAYKTGLKKGLKGELNGRSKLSKKDVQKNSKIEKCYYL